MFKRKHREFLYYALIACAAANWMNAAFAQALPPRAANPNCPEVNLANNWRDYFLSGPNQQFSITFDAMQGKSDAGWGTISKGLCLRGFTGRKVFGEFMGACPMASQILEIIPRMLAKIR